VKTLKSLVGWEIFFHILQQKKYVFNRTVIDLLKEIIFLTVTMNQKIFAKKCYKHSIQNLFEFSASKKNGVMMYKR